MLIQTEKEMLVLGGRLASCVGEASLVTLSGGLGAGKTTLVRGLLQQAGHQGPVRSPTFSLVESYQLPAGIVYHFDLYRLKHAEELQYIGIDAYFDEQALCLVEWPENAADTLPVADINIIIEKVNEGRKVRLETFTDRGTALLQRLTLDNGLTTG